ncbi:hypothetical protein ZIOFF_068518 [Zingiber officinale]|uniref:Uncharacterized protein n=1 Tax=Zingiber officinale TaxID=94328 RepID=A0A8J5C765_ZINOF|nr:hypothetical protein ZIOFF_068518 [Zingiber officinale]
MALTSLQANVVADLCIGKPSARSIPSTATISDALRSFRGVENCFVVWTTDKCVWKVYMVDILCYLCIEENLDAPIAALSAPISVLLLYKSATIVRRLEPDSSLVGEISASTLFSHCDVRVAAAAVAALSSDNLMSLLDYIPPPASAVRSIKEQLRVQGLHGCWSYCRKATSHGHSHLRRHRLLLLPRTKSTHVLGR